MGEPAATDRLLDGSRLLRYAVTGSLSALTHVGTLTLLVEIGATRPVPASTMGFLFSVAVSYSLQKVWVFRSTSPLQRTLPRFLLAALIGLGLNASVLFVGTEVLSLNYLVVQVVALSLIPLSNYLINGLWTFRDRA